MTTIDIIILVIFIVGAVMGMVKGFIKQLASLLGLVVGLLAAKLLYASVAEKLFSQVTDSPTFAQILAFVLIWAAVPLGFAFVAHLLTKAMDAVSLGWINRWLGAGLGAIKYLLVGSMVICGIEFVDADNRLISKSTKCESTLYYPMGEFAGIFMPVVKEVTQQVINADFDDFQDAADEAIDDAAKATKRAADKLEEAAEKVLK